MDERTLIERARDVGARAYAPYSGFPVGAALLADDGSIWVGCNVENASFGLTVCAERAALAAAVGAGRRAFVAIAVSTLAGEPVPPCGACRQVLAEFAPSLRIVSEAGGRIARWSLADLLPEPFVKSPVRDGAGAASESPIPGRTS